MVGELQVWDHAGHHHLPNIWVSEESGDDICEQPDRQPLEDLEDERVRQENLEYENQHRGRNDQPELRDDVSREKRASCGDGAQVGSGVDRVGHEQSGDAGPNQRPGEFAPERDAKADSGVERDSGTQLLDGRHQREGEQGGPQEAVSKLASDL